MDIQDMRIFARVAAVQNLSAVAAELGLTPGTISKRVQALEGELSTRLFDRTTRSLRITEEGQAFLVHVKRILAELEAARSSIDDLMSAPRGKLRIAATAGIGRRYVGPALCAFVSEHPQIEAHLDLRVQAVTLHESGYDVVVRTGALSDSSAIAKRLAPDRQVIAASPVYLERRGRPQHADDLAAHSCLVLGDRALWPLARGGAETAVRVSGPLRSNDADLLRDAALDGRGLILASELELLPELRSGRLVRVLADYEVAGSSNAAVWALYPSARHMVPRLRALLDFLTRWFRDARAEGGIGNGRGFEALPQRCRAATAGGESRTHA